MENVNVIKESKVGVISKAEHDCSANLIILVLEPVEDQNPIP